MHDYLYSHISKDNIKKFFAQRALISTERKINNYPEEIAENLANNLLWWPGVQTAKKDGFTDQILTDCGLQSEKNGKTWTAGFLQEL